ncbi:hypothetical protein A616_24225 [Brevibacillus brevis X23]|nr:hypothetical protein A616_24225 [Brevibacillus brevis X23]
MGHSRGAMEKEKHALKRPPLRSLFEPLLCTRFRFFHGAVQSIPQAGGPRSWSVFSCFLPPRQLEQQVLKKASPQ